MLRYALLITVVLIAVALWLWPRSQNPTPAIESSASPVATSQSAESASVAPEIDPETGLLMSGDWQLVRDNCMACHSAKLITQQRGSAGQWLDVIRWMQATQNLWQFEQETEERIIAYLAQNYPPGTDRRRAAIPPHLMPPNPLRPEQKQ